MTRALYNSSFEDVEQLRKRFEDFRSQREKRTRLPEELWRAAAEILPWVQVRHLASHILGRMAKVVPVDWQKMYAHPVYWLETFIDPARFKGTCYRAAN